MPSPYRAVNIFHLGYKNQSFLCKWHKSLFVLRQIQNKKKTVWAESTIVKIFNLFVHPVTSGLKGTHTHTHTERESLTIFRKRRIYFGDWDAVTYYDAKQVLIYK
jgi:hypothetical protein